ncbi:hypothetical protein [Zobellella taiwanensis]
MANFSAEDKQAILRLYERAIQKNMVADLLLHAYDSEHYQCNMREIMRYIASEPAGSTLKADVMTVLKMMQMGIETHEVLGRERVDTLVG